MLSLLRCGRNRRRSRRIRRCPPARAVGALRAGPDDERPTRRAAPPNRFRPARASCSRPSALLEPSRPPDFSGRRGNTVWWGARDGHVETVRRVPRRAWLSGLPAGLSIACCWPAPRTPAPRSSSDAQVRGVRFDGRRGSERGVSARRPAPAAVTCRFALDASGRTGVIARRGYRRHEPGFLTQAFIGEWERDGGWDLPDDSHTLVETYAEGWAWSVPRLRTIRHVGVAVDGATTRARRGPTLHSTYRTEIGKTQQLSALMAGATLGRVVGLRRVAVFVAPLCRPAVPAGRRRGVRHRPALVVWRQESARVRLGRRRRGPYQPDASRSPGDGAGFLREPRTAGLRHQPPALVGVRARGAGAALAPVLGGAGRRRSATADRDIDEDALFRAPEVQAAFQRLKESPALELALSSAMAIKPCALIRDHEIVLDEALSLPDAPDGVRYLAGVDLLTLGEMACRHRQVADCSTTTATPAAPCRCRACLAACRSCSPGAC